ncbi:hypothetical protein [Burkholderia multivorans]|uniref:hypothetical protein n=1 Tax=Burkholderia multivorans TaxID=87883 RepID=UPI0021BEC7CE|nr:hypothetical protein [Burkholderia multivorans]MDR9052071.1 hypothetical protein [Burkholderia multivorans]MDR9060143.1 hypothetical protein [Burkholderia multivorans]MDR9062448.1 hypothetical protein [Burkholderia multivorans]MDR9072204.1 hypothetical protein [Burkholderia multivorans]MDR9076529.1 hypothetical protein [Burkholderia multivorans]
MARAPKAPAPTDTVESLEDAAALPESSLYERIVSAATAARLAGDFGQHGALLAIETSMIELKHKIAAVEGALGDDARALITELKAVL